MGLRELDLRLSYDSDVDDVLSDFYLPVLGKSTRYMRIAGFFTSLSLYVAARGIQDLLRNGGMVQIIASPKLTKRDSEILKESIENPDSLLADFCMKELKDIGDELIADHIHLLSWMLANKRLEIKLAVLFSESGDVLDYDEAVEQGIFHQKVGILTDDQGESISFSGSINETGKAWTYNVEEFKVFKSWVPGQDDFFKSDLNKFTRYWSSLGKRTKVYSLPAALERNIISLLPNNYDPLSKVVKYSKSSKKSVLFEKQNEAVKAWVDNDYTGIFEMATGTGKTFTSLGCANIVYEKYNSLVLVVTCPQNHLVKQWEREINKFSMTPDSIVICDSTVSGWKDKLADNIYKINFFRSKFLIILTTHDTFTNKTFQDILSIKNDDVKCMLIADEVHGLGTERRREYFSSIYSIRLGLSATPRRWFDPEGTDSIYDYFNGVVYEFTLQEAINTINPSTGYTYLTPFHYLLNSFKLSDLEIHEYIDLTSQIGKQYNSAKTIDEKNHYLEYLIYQRADILKNASLKFDILRNILSNQLHVSNMIIYVSPDQFHTVSTLLNELNLVHSGFTMNEGTRPEPRYGGFSERDYILKKFSDESIPILLAMKCLDQGVDVPSAKHAIIMASSGNPIEYIQRIGRVIRRHPKKTEAYIYDFISKPLRATTPDMMKMQEKIYEIDKRRIVDISNAAINSAEALNKFYSIYT